MVPARNVEPMSEQARPAAPPEVLTCLAAYDTDTPADRTTERAAVKAALASLVATAPGRSVEVRVPPYAAVQAVPGVVHRRGTPPALVQLPARALLRLAVGSLTWAEALASGDVHASGERSDLSGYLPLFQP